MVRRALTTVDALPYWFKVAAPIALAALLTWFTITTTANQKNLQAAVCELKAEQKANDRADLARSVRQYPVYREVFPITKEQAPAFDRINRERYDRLRNRTLPRDCGQRDDPDLPPLPRLVDVLDDAQPPEAAP